MPRLPAPAEPQTQPADALTDEELVQAVRAGDEAAFTRLFERHKRLVAHLASRFFPRSEDVEELVQDVFTETFLGLDRYRGGRERSFAAWLKRITVTTCYDALRLVRARGAETTQALGDAEVSAVNGLFQGVRLTAEESIILRDSAVKLLARLAPEDRLVLTLLSTGEASVRDIAAMTGWSEAKVKVRAYRARRALRAVVKAFL
jgi:RNA polymerase sigma-70 factor (ECF subfamily)